MTIRHPGWWLAAALAAGAAWALDPPRPVPAPGPAAETAAETAAPDAAQPPAEAPAEEDPPPPADARSVGPTPQRFDPSEKVRADFPVSFPIDI